MSDITNSEVHTHIPQDLHTPSTHSRKEIYILLRTLHISYGIHAFNSQLSAKLYNPKCLTSQILKYIHDQHTPPHIEGGKSTFVMYVTLHISYNNNINSHLMNTTIYTNYSCLNCIASYAIIVVVILFSACVADCGKLCPGQEQHSQ